MTAWPKDSQTARNAFYGDPGKRRIAAQRVPVIPPFAMYYDGKRVRAIQFHPKAAPRPPWGGLARRLAAFSKTIRRRKL